jgi:hypothetical protein
MEFYLNYHGTLSTTGHAKLKFQYRRAFLQQLKELDLYYKLNKVPDEIGFSLKKLKVVGPFKFLPLVTRDSNLEVDLEIVLLSQMGPGGEKQSYGDLDNLLKALIDGLRMAQNANEIRNEVPGPGEEPFFCLLEDDQVIRNINISHKKLFFAAQKTGKKGRSQEIFALIKVKIAPKFPLLLNLTDAATDLK